MPYIITTRAYGTSSACPRLPAPRIRRAVATLDEAHDAVIEALPDPAEGWSTEALNIAQLIPEAGGTIGPLPDGTVIEVAQVTWHDLIDAIGGGVPEIPERADDTIAAEIIDAYNAAQGVASVN